MDIMTEFDENTCTTTHVAQLHSSSLGKLGTAVTMLNDQLMVEMTRKLLP